MKSIMKNMIVSLMVMSSLMSFVGIGYAAQLDEKTQQALISAINDEYKAKATYQKVIDTFGEVRPFTNIIKAEEQHIQELTVLFEKYGVALPKDEWYAQVPEFASLQEALEAGIKAEIENAKMYDEFFTFVKEQDILDTFKNLRDASQQKHLPAFERALEQGDKQGKGNNQSRTQGQGQRKGQGTGQGQGKGQGR
jgi:hypothetical protein